MPAPRLGRARRSKSFSLSGSNHTIVYPIKRGPSGWYIIPDGPLSLSSWSAQRRFFIAYYGWAGCLYRSSLQAEELRESLDAVFVIGHAARLAAAVHAQDGVAHVYATQGQ